VRAHLQSEKGYAYEDSVPRRSHLRRRSAGVFKPFLPSLESVLNSIPCLFPQIPNPKETWKKNSEKNSKVKLAFEVLKSMQPKHHEELLCELARSVAAPDPPKTLKPHLCPGSRCCEATPPRRFPQPFQTRHMPLASPPLTAFRQGPFRSLLGVQTLPPAGSSLTYWSLSRSGGVGRP
jgi:hypothetical protein